VHTGLLAAGVVLLLALVVAIIVLQLDSRNKRLEERIETVAEFGPLREQEQDRPLSIRVSRRRGAGTRELAYTLLRVPVGIPRANVVPIWFVFASGIVAGIAESWVAFIFVSPVTAWISAVATGLLLIRGTFGWEVERYRKQLLGQIADALELVGSATRAGLPATEAFRMLAREMPSPTRDEFTQVVNEIAVGAAVEDALMGVHRRTRLSEYAIFAVTMAIQTKSGGRLSETIQNLAETVRQRVAIAGRAEALSAEAKLSARVITALPFVGGAAMSFLQQGFLTPLLHDPRGKRLVVIGVVTLLLGMFTMRKLIQGVSKD
jgi:tight adherence protein B